MSMPYPWIIDTQYCLPCDVQLNVHRKFLRFMGKFNITDIDGNSIFKVDSAFMTLHSRHVLRDAAGHPIVTLHKKIMTMHDRWEVFRGESTHSNDLLFSVKRKSIIQVKIQLDVFLANNTSEDAWDFMVDVGWPKRSCVVYGGQSSNILATMVNVHGCKFVTVNPGVDYAFIAALIVILDNMKKIDRISKIAIHHTIGALGGAGFGGSELLSDQMDSFWG